MLLSPAFFPYNMLAPPGRPAFLPGLQSFAPCSFLALTSPSTSTSAFLDLSSAALALSPAYTARSHGICRCTRPSSNRCMPLSSCSSLADIHALQPMCKLVLFDRGGTMKLSTRLKEAYEGGHAVLLSKAEITSIGKKGNRMNKQKLLGKCKAVSTVEILDSTTPKKSRGKKKQQPEGELMEPEFYKMGYLRYVRAYGIHFKEGPDGVGVFSAKNLPFLEKPRMILEIPLELMITVSKYPPWMFFPNIVPIGHPVFDIINATDAKSDWDIRLATLLLLAMDKEGDFWHVYSDYLPEVPESTDLLFASEEELVELQDMAFAQDMREEQIRAEETWKKYWTPDLILKVKRLARTSEKFKWALSIARTRCITMTMAVGTKIQEANMLIPYADMFNHSFAPTCSLRWRTKDRMLEVLINAGQSIKEGDEMTLNYLDRTADREYMRLYGLSSAVNPWTTMSFSGKSKIHLDSFLSAFNITGLPDHYYFNEAVAERKDTFVDGAVLAMARYLPTWSDGDLPFLPSEEKRAVKDLQRECRLQLAAFPTTVDHDNKLLATEGESRGLRWKAIIKYRIDRKLILKKVIRALELYLTRILY
ncbi:hypothetical protein O6H91_21G072600 [Diphasiastrum complanatum]|uniref:Uncharacterized protein n=1 Tax=Diphasiastrum complanatum TaxID=34168 RepID=A0ACC2ALT4_DIPCM|nr:hypothetical protein O6H91_21G072600 [Diphasiastrum complanatum]